MESDKVKAEAFDKIREARTRWGAMYVNDWKFITDIATIINEYEYANESKEPIESSQGEGTSLSYF